MKEQTGQFVKETSAVIFSYLETGTTVLARHNKTLLEIAMELFNRNIPFKLARNLKKEFTDYLEKGDDGEDNIIKNWFRDLRNA